MKTKVKQLAEEWLESRGFNGPTLRDCGRKLLAAIEEDDRQLAESLEQTAANYAKLAPTPPFSLPKIP